MLMKTPQALLDAEKLKQVKALLENNWCFGKMKRMIKGTQYNCLLGAIDRSYYDQVDEQVDDYSGFWECRQRLFAAMGFTGGCEAMVFNDHQYDGVKTYGPAPAPIIARVQSGINKLMEEGGA